jgi:hypothetical protein
MTVLGMATTVQQRNSTTTPLHHSSLLVLKADIERQPGIACRIAPRPVEHMCWFMR